MWYLEGRRLDKHYNYERDELITIPPTYRGHRLPPIKGSAHIFETASLIRVLDSSDARPGGGTEYIDIPYEIDGFPAALAKVMLVAG